MTVHFCLLKHVREDDDDDGVWGCPCLWICHCRSCVFVSSSLRTRIIMLKLRSEVVYDCESDDSSFLLVYSCS